MRVLVTGGAGYIGSHACKALAQASHVPIVYDNLCNGHRSAVKWGPFEHGDILDGIRLSEAFSRHKPDAVIHFAGLAYVGESILRPDIYYRNNVSGTLTLLDVMKRYDVSRLVFSSTCATYGIPTSLPIAEHVQQSPINPYGRSKLMVEHILADFCMANKLAVTSLRYFNAAGAHADGDLGEQHDPETHLIPLTLAAARGTAPALQVFGNDYSTPDGTCVRDYLHVVDLALAHVVGLDACQPGRFRAFNLGTGRGVSVSEIIASVERVTGKAVPFQIQPRRPGDPPELVADPSRAAVELNWQAKHVSIDRIIKDAWHWMIRNEN